MKFPASSLLLFFALALNAHELPPGFAALQIADGLDPVDMAQTPDGRIFLTEKFGRVLVIENGILLPDPFLEIPVDNFNERGLSGIAISPDFASNGHVFLYFTVPGGGHNRVSRFTAAGNFALPGSEVALLDLDPLEGPHHNAGAMDFGPDGKLYIATGDGFSTDVSQDINSTLGKILRINPDGSITADNPFFGQTTGNARSIWALGFRNPFSMSAGNGRLFASDVGSHRFEEINEVFPGKNYGWPIAEGMIMGQVPPPDYLDPIHAYGHTVNTCSVTGVELYSPASPNFPAPFLGKLFYADYCSGEIRFFDPENGQDDPFASGINRPLNLLTGHDGTLYFIARGGIEGGSSTANTASSEGELWRVFYTGNNAPFIAVQPKSQLVPEGEDAVFQTSVSGAAPLFFQWQKNGLDLPAANGPVFIFENPSLADSGAVLRCIVTNTEGSDTTQLVEIQVTTNQRPLLEITLPAEGTTYHAGDTLTFLGSATDPEDGLLPPANYRWKIDFLHAGHSHPALGPVSGAGGGTLPIPQAGEVSPEVWFRIHFTATDASGLSRTEQRLVFPEKTSFELKTSPPGLPIETDGIFSQTPYSIESVIGVLHQMKAPETQLANDSLYQFERWSVGGTARQLLFETPENQSVITAIYAPKTSLAKGGGLRAFYFDDPLEANGFTQPFSFSQVDPQVKFDWGPGSPNEAELGNNHFLVRWEGYLLPIVSGQHRFHVISDDGARLWVGDSLLIDQWVGQARTEHAGETSLQAGRFYPVKLEYFEDVGEALVQLLWSGTGLERGFVPSSQLFPTLPVDALEAGKIWTKIFPNPVSGALTLEMGSLAEMPVELTILNAAGQVFFQEKTTLPSGFSRQEIALRGMANGVYFLKIFGGDFTTTLQFIKT